MDYGDLREGIYDAICTGVPQVWDTSSPPKCKVFWGWTAPGDTPKPFITMNFAGELAPANGNKCGLFMQLDIEVYGEESNILAIDPIADLVVSVLHQQPIITPLGRTIYLKYVRDARFDAWSEELRASMIRLKFLLPTDFWV